MYRFSHPLHRNIQGYFCPPMTWEPIACSPFAVCPEGSQRYFNWGTLFLAIIPAIFGFLWLFVPAHILNKYCSCCCSQPLSAEEEAEEMYGGGGGGFHSKSASTTLSPNSRSMRRRRTTGMLIA
jgi:hypothetical protein